MLPVDILGAYHVNICEDEYDLWCGSGGSTHVLADLFNGPCRESFKRCRDGVYRKTGGGHSYDAEEDILTILELIGYT